MPTGVTGHGNCGPERLRSPGPSVHSGTASVALRHVDLLQKPTTRLDAADIGCDLPGQLSHRRAPSNVRHDGHPWMQPERALRRQWLRPKGIKRCVGKLAGVEGLDQLGVDDVLAATDIHDHGAL